MFSILKYMIRRNNVQHMIIFFISTQNILFFLNVSPSTENSILDTAELETLPRQSQPLVIITKLVTDYCS